MCTLSTLVNCGQMRHTNSFELERELQINAVLRILHSIPFLKEMDHISKNIKQHNCF